MDIDKNGNCRKCGEFASEYGQGLNHKCKSKPLRWLCGTCGFMSVMGSQEFENHNCQTVKQEKTFGEKAEEIAECVAASKNIEKDLDRILDSTPTDPIMKNFNQAFKDGMKKKSEPIDDGGPAFSHAASNGHCCGASLRDLFAGMALIGLSGNEKFMKDQLNEWHKSTNSSDPELLRGFLSNTCYLFADSMLKERSK